MERVYSELEENLQIIYDDFVENESSVSKQIKLTVIDELETELVYGISFIYIHEANHLIGSCIGGGGEFIELIEVEGTVFHTVIKNFNELGLTVLSVDSEL